MKHLYNFIKVILLVIVFLKPAHAINDFKYLDKEVTGEFCKKLFQRLDFPGFPSGQKKPFKLNTELIIEDINKVDGKNLDFDALFTCLLYTSDAADE